MKWLTRSRQAAGSEPAGLRRADWRFLVPQPDGVFRHLVLIGGPDNLPDKLLGHGFARRVSVRYPPESRTADAIAVFWPAGVDYEQAARVLAPGGSLYIELDRRSPGGMTLALPGVLRRLKQAGFTVVRLYWAAPDFQHCKRYLPLDIAEPFRWYLSTLYMAGSLKHRLIEAGLRLLSRLRAFRFTMLAPCVAVVATAGASQPILPSIFGSPALPREMQRPDLHPVLLTSGQDDGSRAVILPFLPGDRQPLAAIKVSSLPGYNVNIEREQANLREVRDRLAPGLTGTVPEPLGQFRFGPLQGSIERYTAGHPQFVSSGRWPGSFERQVEDLTLAADWLCAFHRSTQVHRRPWDEAADRQWIQAPCAAYANTFGLTAEEDCLFLLARRCSQALAGVPFPVVRMHYDFIPGNIYGSQREITVIDWEFGGNWRREPSGPALYDLLFYVTYWFHLVHRVEDVTGEVRAFERLFIHPQETDRYVKAAQQEICSYLSSLEIDPRFLPLILVYLWVEQALHKAFRKQSLQSEPADLRAGNHAVRRVELMARFARDLFRA